MNRRKSTRFLSALAGATLIFAACGGGDDDADVVNDGDVLTDDTSESGGTEPADTASTEPAGEPDTSDPDTSEAGSDSVPAGAENVGVEGGSGCGIPHGPYEDMGEPSGEVRVAWNDPLLSFNTNSSRGNAIANSNPSYLMGLGNGGGFWYYDGDLNLINNDQFGTCTIESLDPLTITYRINEGVTWSDGTQIDAADLVLVLGRGQQRTSTTARPSSPPTAPRPRRTPTGCRSSLEPRAVPRCPTPRFRTPRRATLPRAAPTRSPPTSRSTRRASRWSLVTEFPEISDDGLSATITWDSFYVDYQHGGLIVGAPAHVVGQNALGIDDPAEAKQALIDAFQSNDAAALKPISEFWNTGFDATSLPDDPGLYLSAGPYMLTSYDEVSQMTFEANPRLHVGPEAEGADDRLPHHR